MCCRFDPSGSLLAVGLANGVIKVKLRHLYVHFLIQDKYLNFIKIFF
mgnify:CR=1 FL=1